jgi:hypothetical protein
VDYVIPPQEKEKSTFVERKIGCISVFQKKKKKVVHCIEIWE